MHWVKKDLLFLVFFDFVDIFQDLSDRNGPFLCAIILEEHDNPNFFGILGGKVLLFEVLFVF